MKKDLRIMLNSFTVLMLILITRLSFACQQIKQQELKDVCLGVRAFYNKTKIVSTDKLISQKAKLVLESFDPSLSKSKDCIEKLSIYNPKILSCLTYIIVQQNLSEEETDRINGLISKIKKDDFKFNLLAAHILNVGLGPDAGLIPFFRFGDRKKVQYANSIICIANPAFIMAFLTGKNIKKSKPLKESSQSKKKSMIAKEHGINYFAHDGKIDNILNSLKMGELKSACTIKNERSKDPCVFLQGMTKYNYHLYYGDVELLFSTEILDKTFYYWNIGWPFGIFENDKSITNFSNNSELEHFLKKMEEKNSTREKPLAETDELVFINKFKIFPYLKKIIVDKTIKDYDIKFKKIKEVLSEKGYSSIEVIGQDEDDE